MAAKSRLVELRQEPRQEEAAAVPQESGQVEEGNIADSDNCTAGVDQKDLVAPEQ